MKEEEIFTTARSVRNRTSPRIIREGMLYILIKVVTQVV